MKIVFFGTPEFAVASLRRLLDDGHEVAAVVTMPDKIAGRGHKLIQSDVKKFAADRGLEVLQPEKLRDPAFIDALRRIDADLFVVIAFRMLPEMVWGMPPSGTFNLHASLLPAYRGAAPINWAIINGETRTGVTTFFLSHEIDTGDIIARREVEILPEDNAGTLHDKLMELGAEMTSRTVADIAAGTVRTQPQPDGEFIPAPKIFKDTCRIDWSLPVVRVHDLVRGLSPYPAAWSRVRYQDGSEQDVKIFETAPVAPGSVLFEAQTPGECRVESRRLFVACGDGWIEILSLQPAGKKRMSAHDFLLGYSPEQFEN